MIDKKLQFGIRNVGQNLWLPDTNERFGAELSPLQAWWRADVASSIVTSGTAVTSWNNLVAGGKWNLQGSGSGPTTGGSINGVPALIFSGSGGQNLSSVTRFSVGVPKNGNWTIIQLVDIGTVDKNNDTLWNMLDGDGRIAQVQTSSSTQFDGKFNSNDLGIGNNIDFSGNPYSGPHIIVTDLSSSDDTVRIRIDGTQVGIRTDYTNNMGNSVRFELMTAAAGGKNMGGSVGECVLAQCATNGFTDSEEFIQKCEGYLAYKYGLQSQLPVSHPYKTQPPREDNASAGQANLAPTAANSTVTYTEGTGPYTFDVSDFNYNDGDGDTMVHVSVESLPGTGTLSLDGVAVTLGQNITTADINANKFTFADAGGNGSPYTSFNFSVNDGTADSIIYSMTVNINPGAA